MTTSADRDDPLDRDGREVREVGKQVCDDGGADQEHGRCGHVQPDAQPAGHDREQERAGQSEQDQAEFGGIAHLRKRQPRESSTATSVLGATVR